MSPSNKIKSNMTYKSTLGIKANQQQYLNIHHQIREHNNMSQQSNMSSNTNNPPKCYMTRALTHYLSKWKRPTRLLRYPRAKHHYRYLRYLSDVA